MSTETKKTTAYKTKNWSEYNKSLVKRGSITLWINEKALKDWLSQNSSGRKGRPMLYSDGCIELFLTIGSFFHLPLRATQGYLESLFSLLKVDLPVPDYTCVSKRSKSLEIKLVKNRNGSLELVLDATGLKNTGEGEWLTRTHGKTKRRGWRKLHIAMDPKTFGIVAVELTESNKADGKLLAPLLENVDSVDKVYADAAYMYKECFDAVADKGGEALIDLRSNTSLAREPTSEGLKQRNKIVNRIQELGGKEEWKKESGYHKRSLVETQMYRWKQILGPKLRARKFENQVVEAKIKANILNQLTALGMPKTQAVPV